MKAIVGWLSDPWIHLAGIGILVVTLGARLGSAGQVKGEATSGAGCETCRKVHDAGRPCYEAVTADLAVVPGR